MKDIIVQKYKVKRLWKWCEDGLFAIPEIQREFVWDVKKACKLLDSIYRRLPIGSLLIWETGADRQNLLRHAQNILPEFNYRNKKIWFLIDGQQRLSVLHRVRKGGSVINYNDKEVDFDHLCFSFDKRFDIRFIKIRRPISKLHIPMVSILSQNWRNKLRHLSNKKFTEIEKLRNLIQDYEVPAILINTGNLEDVRESFLRINSGGLRISAADQAFTRASRLNLRHLVNDLRTNLPNGFNQIDRGIIQFAAALILGEREVGGRAVESALMKEEKREFQAGKVSKHFSKKWGEIRECTRKAVDYLSAELGLPNYDFLPSDNMLATLSYFFYANNRAQPLFNQKHELRKWFWATSVAGRYAGRGYRQNILKDVNFFESLGKRRNGRFAFHDLVPMSEIKRTDYLTASGLTTAFFLLLCKRDPLYLETGGRIPLGQAASPANRKDKHHIFPKALLQRNNFSTKQANSLCNICFVVAEENQSIGSNKPRVYLTRYKKRRQFARVMKSHLIPYKSDSGLWSGNVKKGFRRFQGQRLEVIRKAFEKEAGIKLFRED
jgi:hypothetical protein